MTSGVRIAPAMATAMATALGKPLRSQCDPMTKTETEIDNYLRMHASHAAYRKDQLNYRCTHLQTQVDLLTTDRTRDIKRGTVDDDRG